MAIHYAAPTTKSLIRVDTPGLFEFFSPLDGNLKSIAVYSGQAVQGTQAARVAVRTSTGATLGVVEIAPGASSGSETMDVPVTAGLLVSVDIDESTQAGIGAPLTVVLAIDDGVAGGTTPGDDGNGATLPANAITENDEAVEQDGELLVEE